MVNFDDNAIGRSLAENPDNQLSAVIKKPDNINTFNEFIRAAVLLFLLAYAPILFSCLQRILPLGLEYLLLMAQAVAIGILGVGLFFRYLKMCKVALQNQSTWLQALRIRDVLPGDFWAGLVIMLIGCLVCLSSLLTTQFDQALFIVILSAPTVFIGVTIAESTMTKKARIHTRAYLHIKALVQQHFFKR